MSLEKIKIKRKYIKKIFKLNPNKNFFILKRNMFLLDRYEKDIYKKYNYLIGNIVDTNNYNYMYLMYKIITNENFNYLNYNKIFLIDNYFKKKNDVMKYLLTNGNKNLILIEFI